MSFVRSKPETELTPSEKKFLDRNERLLGHPSTCKTLNCGEPGCSELRRFVLHALFCETKIKGKCQKCINIVALALYHDKRCNQDRTPAVSSTCVVK